jgi:hypothetical protein
LWREVEVSGCLLGRALFARDAVPKRDHAALRDRQCAEQLGERGAREASIDVLVGPSGLSVGKLNGGLTVGRQGLERDEGRRGQRLLDLSEREGRRGGDLGERRLALELERRRSWT